MNRYPLPDLLKGFAVFLIVPVHILEKFIDYPGRESQFGKKSAESPVIGFLRWLGKNITVFYIIQWLIIGNIATAIYQTQELSKYVYWYVPVFLGTVGLTFVFEKIFNLWLKPKESNTIKVN